MRLVILGGGGFRVPLVHKALVADGRVDELVLHDVDPARLARIRAVLRGGPRVRVTTDLDDALRDADFVFSAIRVGGLAGRAIDEQVAHAHGVLGQETVGAGGIAYGLRTAPVARDIARRVARLAPRAWVINFTNPAGLVTEVMAEHLGPRVIGICDSPVGLCRRVAHALGVEGATFDYAGLNHLGWLQGVHLDGEDLLPRLLADAEALRSFEEGRLFGAEWLQALGVIPNEYLHYYYDTRDAMGDDRGAFLLRQQERFYDGEVDWETTRLEREATYMKQDRDTLEGGGYEHVALRLMRAIADDERTTLILNVRNGSTLSTLDAEAVVEVPCAVDANGAEPLPVSRLPDHAAGLVLSVKAVDRLVVEGTRAAALKAFALHPLVDSLSAAEGLLDAYARRHPELAHLS
ncbi:family 4 glycosyl hydrolase [Saccharothrix algeriensis]|uniref:6-phospho-beta-glucosidase n=1 Tax=Saccharothrix algeriensis TaxID=173560 RepID=A0A8T8I228_9PSEU|nr:6-phospho-beta-glucosidase [Saccharothrix algeriensis]MBM7810703.1 6-phospho-beta-glucosidase [Saccharothrix algeriensis]QTR04769.1 6-phospho-beta-glucosidase [Saccharothrix algeriensis]